MAYAHCLVCQVEKHESAFGVCGYCGDKLRKENEELRAACVDALSLLDKTWRDNNLRGFSNYLSEIHRIRDAIKSIDGTQHELN